MKCMFYVQISYNLSYYSFIYSLFFGDYVNPISISSIRIIETATNYQEIVSAITLFDNVINGVENPGYVSSSCLLILSHLIVERAENKFDPFIYNSWKVFLQKKTKIKINMSRMPKDLGFLGLIFGGRGLEEHEDEDDDYIPDDDDMTNILKLNVLSLFNNLQTMEICNVYDYPFSLYQLVSLLTHTKIKKVLIYNDKWLYSLWCDCSSSLIKAYKNNGYAVEYNGVEMSINLL